MDEKRVVLDCERMKFPFTGLYYFCRELGRAIRKIENHSFLMDFYVPKDEVGIFGNDAVYHLLRPSHKYLSSSLPHCDIWHSTFQGSSYLPTKSAGAKIVSTIHDLNFLHEWKTPQKQKKYLRKTQRLVDKADRIVAISHFVKGEILQYLDTKGKEVEVIYNGRNLPPARPFQKPEGNFDTPFFFSIGTIAPKKRFHVLPALLLNNDAELIIAGVTHDGKYKQKIMEEAIRLGVQKRVRLIGPVSDSEKYWLMEHCLGFCFPSAAEGFGLPVIEAMQIGVPVLLSTDTALPEIGGPHALFFENLSPEGINSTALKFLQTTFTTEKRNELIAWAEQFSWERAANAYQNIYTTLLKSQK